MQSIDKWLYENVPNTSINFTEFLETGVVSVHNKESLKQWITSIEPSTDSYETAKSKVKELFITSVESCLKSSCSIAVSGGFDSTLILRVATEILGIPVSKLDLFTFPLNQEDLECTKLLNLKNLNWYFPKEHVSKYLDYLAWLPAPVSDIGLFGFWLFESKEILTGIGAEFLFGGTIDHLALALAQNIVTKQVEPKLRNVANLALAMNVYKKKLLALKSGEPLPEVLKTSFCSTLFDREVMIFSYFYKSFGTKGLFPFLSIDFIEYVFSLPIDFRLNKYCFKYILADAFSDILPEFIFKRTKTGFKYTDENKAEMLELFYGKEAVSLYGLDKNRLALESWYNVQQNLQ